MPATPSKDASLHKRQQIAKSSRTMFIWVAAASVVVGVAIVVSWFLIKQIIFKQRVLVEKNNTVSTLQSNIREAQTLKDNLRVLETNAALSSVKANPDDKALQVILDTLPAENNTLALGASIQNKIVGGVPGVSIESLATTGSGDSSSAGNEVAEMPFVLSVTTQDVGTARDFLRKMESSIRVIDIDSMKIERNGERMALHLDAHAYYLGAKRIELTKKEIREQ